MLRRFFLIFTLGLLWAAPASAGWFSGGNDIQTALSTPRIAIGGYALNVKELKAFYTARDFRPAWDFSGEDSGQTFAAFLDSITRVIDYHGLEAGNYPIGLMKKLAAAPDSGSKTGLELLVTNTLLRLAHDLHGDTIDLADLYPGWNFGRKPVDIPTALAAAVSANNLNDYIEGLAPKNPAYTQLAEDLQTYRGIAANGGWPKIDPGPSLKLHDEGPRIAELRARLAAENYLPQPGSSGPENQIFDENLQKSLENYQMHNGLAIDGVVGPATLAALNIPVSGRIDQIRANMERWRHMPGDFPPDRYVLVNIPDASVQITEDGKAIYSGIVIIGRVDRKTPFIHSLIRSMIVNPSWHVPAKIAKKDILPKLRKDPHYLEKLGFVIRGDEDDPHGEKIDWQSMPEQEFNYHLRQEPGTQNSLGRLKFDFDNDFAVYMHGTPHQELFKKNQRTLSSGCIRLHDPEQVALILLSRNKATWDAAKIEDEIQAGKTHWVGIADPMPLYILYWTVFTGDEGHIEFRKDVYNYDSFLIDNMKNGNGLSRQAIE